MADMRSFWFLFPVANYTTLPLAIAQEEEITEPLSPTCYGCDKLFPPVRDPLHPVIPLPPSLLLLPPPSSELPGGMSHLSRLYNRV